MAMLGNPDDLALLVNPRSRLRRGLAILQDCLAQQLAGVLGDIASLQPGETRRLAVDGETVYLLIQCYRSKERNAGRFEAHARHTDLQYVWSGRERIEVCGLRAVQPEPSYDANGNFFFSIGDDVHSQLLVQAGEVAVLSPQDAHAPCLRANDDESELVRKIVVKIQDAHLPAPGPVSMTATHASITAEIPLIAPKT